MGLPGFSERFETAEQYIIDITYEIWEERGLDKIWDYYSTDCPVKTPMSFVTGVEPVIAGTQATLDQFPDRQLLADDILIGEWEPETFYSSHRVRSPATHLGDGLFGPATGKPITMLTIADCICRGDKIVDEYLVRDNAGVAVQLGIEPLDQVKKMIAEGNKDGHTQAADLVNRWSDEALVCGDPDIARPVIAAYQKRFGELAPGSAFSHFYDRAIRFEGSGHSLAYGFERLRAWDEARLAGLSNPDFRVHHTIVKKTPGRPVRVALRWSLEADHKKASMFGPAVERRIALLGASHFELRDGKIINEWCIFDELSVYAQLLCA